MPAASVGKSLIATGCWIRLGFHSRQSETPKKADGGNCKISLRFGISLKGQLTIVRDSRRQWRPRCLLRGFAATPEPPRPGRGHPSRWLLLDRFSFLTIREFGMHIVADTLDDAMAEL